MLPAAVAFNDGCLEGYPLETKHMERDISGGRREVPVKVIAVVALTGLAALVAVSIFMLFSICATYYTLSRISVFIRAFYS